MTTAYVLVHDAFHGGWCWARVAALLQAAGYQAHAPSLTGLRDQAHLLTAEVGLDTHTTDIVRLMEHEDLRDVILVGHSYAGMIIIAAADLVPDRVAHLVYVDTFVPRDGEAIADIMPIPMAAFQESARESGDGWRVPPPNMPPGVHGIYGVTEEPDVSWVQSMQTPQSLKTFEQSLHMTNPTAVAAIPRTHLHCTEGGAEYKRIRQITMSRTYPPTDDLNARVRALPTGHDCMITMPREVTDILLDLAKPDVTRPAAASPETTK